MSGLGKMLGDVIVNLEHGALVTAEHLLEIGIGQDLALILRILQVLGLDVIPDLADDLTARQGIVAHDHAKLLRWL